MTRNTIHKQRGTSRVLLWVPDIDDFNNDVSHRGGVKYHRSIFDRWNYKASDGSRLKLTSHQARHLLSTIADRGGLSQDEAAKWAGRADQRQNRVYVHRDEFEKVAQAEAIDPALTLFGPPGEIAPEPPVSREELSIIPRGPVHITDIGVCVHDWSIVPCEKFRDCTNCQEHIFVKGEDQCLKRIKERLHQTEIDYAAAREAIQAGHYGADRWYERLDREVTRLRELVRILEDPSVPDGSQIRLKGGDFTHLRRVLTSKATSDLLNTATDDGLLAAAARRLGGQVA
jgi:hypothetical protein